MIHYAYYRYNLHLSKQWNGIKNVSSFNLGYGFTFSICCSGTLLMYLFDYIFDFKEYFEIIYIFVIISLIILSLFMPNIQDIEEAYKNHDRSTLEWKIKGYLSMLFIFGPPIFIIIYMFIN